MSTTTALRAADFTQSIGVNVHMEYTDGGYANVSNVLADLKYLGVTQVRDGTFNPKNQGQSHYAPLAQAGIHFDMIIGGVSNAQTLASQLALLDSFQKTYPGAVSAIEGPNEVNNWPVSYGGVTGTNGAIALENALINAVKADPTLKSVQLFNLTSWPDIGTNAPIANFHSYPQGGSQPFATLQANMNAQLSVMSGKPIVLTEAGYLNAPQLGGVDGDTQGKLTLNLIMDATKLGVKQVYLYELMDAYADPTNSSSGKHYGLFDHSNAPKPVATDIHNLMAILADTATNSHTFATTAINYTLAGLPSTGSSFELVKSTGAHDIVVWAEPADWNNSTHTPIAVAPTTVTVTLDQTYSTVSVYDPTQGSTPISVLHDVKSVQLAVSDHPLIVEVGPGVTKTVVSTAPTTTTTTSSFHLPLGVSGHSILSHSIFG